MSQQSAVGPTNFLLLLFTLIAGTCLAEIFVETTKSQQSGLIEATVNILKTCYADRVGTVGLAGNLAGTIGEKLWSWKFVPVTLIDEAARTVDHDPVQPASRHRVKVFVITATSSIVLPETLMEIKKSKFWNHMASVLVLDRSIQGCSNAFQVLWAAWEMDLLGGKFLCLHETRGRLIYTYNPYTSEAPEPWQVENTFSGKNNHTWTLFVRGYREDDGNCDELDFDKARDLGGYEIRSTVVDTSTPLTNISRARNGSANFGGISGKVAHLIFRLLNATPVILDPEPLGFVDDEGRPHGGVAEVANGISDIALSLNYRIDVENFTTTRSLWESGPIIMTQYRAHASQLKKLAYLVDVYTRFGLGLVFLITLAFFAFFLRQSPSSAFLNTVLVTCSVALPKIPENLASRIYLACLFIFMINIQGIYQGNLASLLSKQVPLRNVNSMRDLVDLDYKIYTKHMLSHLLVDSIPEGYPVQGSHFSECINIVLRDSDAACISEKITLIDTAAKFKLHLSTELIAKLYWILMMRDNWPPEKALDTILSRLVEADVVRVIYEQETLKLLRRLEINESEENDQSFKVLTLKELGFAFVILAIGLLCAILCFVIEMGVRRARFKTRENMFGVERED